MDQVRELDQGPADVSDAMQQRMENSEDIAVATGKDFRDEDVLIQDVEERVKSMHEAIDPWLR